ncbi:MAG: TolC family protein [Candidatus Methylacidiphilales bacterium]|nr:TolC family protein [Candidatus Methylacidiphilales bacterium]
MKPNRIPGLALVLLLAPLAGVAQYTPTPTPAPAPPSPSSTAPAQGVITLDEAIRLALEQNLDLAIERMNPERAATNILAARAAFDPRFNLASRYSENSTPRSSEQQAADGFPSFESRTFNASTGVTQPTILGTEVGLAANTTNRMNTSNNFEDEYTAFAGATLRHPLLKNAGPTANRAQFRIATKGKEQSDATFLNRIDQLVAEVHRAYYEWIFSLDDLRSKEKTLLLAERLQKDNQGRLDNGIMTPLDVAQARSETALRRSDVIQAQLSVDQNLNRLRRLISRDLATSLAQPLEPGETLPAPEALSPSFVDLGLALQNRKDYLALQRQAEADGLRLEFTKNQLLPQVDLEGSYGFNGLDRDLVQSFNRVADTRDPGWFVGLSVEIPWGSQAEKARHQDAQLVRQQTLLRLKNTEQQILLEVDNAAKTVESAWKKYESNLVASTISEQSAIAEEEKLKAGISTSYTVLQLQRDAASARTQELRALTDYHLALVNLRLAQGILTPLSGVRVEKTPSASEAVSPTGPTSTP